MAYNVKVLEYPAGTQVRVYNKVRTSVGEVVKNVDAETGEVIKKKRSLKNPVRDPFNPGKIASELPDSEESLRCALSRTKTTVYNIARSNRWDWFVTFTIDKARLDRHDYDLLSKRILDWFKDVRKKISPNIKYLYVPEQHRNGAWHFHGLLADCPELSFLDSGLEAAGHKIYNLPRWRYGFTAATKVLDTGKVSGYICKYITKDLCALTLGKHRYRASRNCNRVLGKEFLLESEELNNFKLEMLDKCNYKKRVEGNFLIVDYYEFNKK